MMRLSRMQSWLGLSAAQRKHPRHMEFIIASSGRPALTLRLNVYYVQWVMVSLVLFLMFWLASMGWAAYYHYANSNTLDKMGAIELKVKQLEQHNTELAKSRTVLASRYQFMADRLNNLESKIRMVASRYHLSNLDKSASVPTKGGVGGVAYPVGQLQAIAAFQQQTQSRIGGLDTTLNQILARPEGWPITHTAEITSHFGVRANPFGEATYEFHKGLDFAAGINTPVMVTAPGVVIEAGQFGPNGNLVVVDHGYGYRTGYAHLSQIKVKVGDKVAVGQVVGLLGNTGRSTGPHLHYAVYLNGVLIDPYPYIE